MNHSANYSAASVSATWDIGASIVTAFEAGGLSLALIIFLMWVIRMVLISRRRQHE